ncbi:MAG: hypothetical protein HUU29_02440 [Planctomycetaceae bacterium]|nr:hypothetical protein [Planctomycetaceae bacterium]
MAEILASETENGPILAQHQDAKTESTFAVVKNTDQPQARVTPQENSPGGEFGADESWRWRSESNRRVTDLQPVIEKSQPLDESKDTQNPDFRLASCLAFLSEKHPDLAAVVAQWPTLPDHARKTILALVEGLIPRNGDKR